MGVAVDKPGKDHFTVKVDYVRVFIDEVGNSGIAADINDFLAADGNGFRPAPIFINRINHTVFKHKIGVLPIHIAMGCRIMGHLYSILFRY